MSTTESVTQLLKKWRNGDEKSEELLYQKILPVLRKQARIIKNDHNGMVDLDTTEIMHEAYMKLNDAKQFSFKDQAHFFAISAKVIRHLLIDYLRKAGSQKRGGNLPLIAIEEVENQPSISYDSNYNWLLIDRAMNELAAIDPVCAQVVEMKFFSAMTLAEISEACQCSVMTVRRKWRFAKAWLTSQLEDNET